MSISKQLQGLRGAELNQVLGVADAEFVHATGFIGGCWSIESAIKMAEVSIAHHLAEQVEKIELQKKQKTDE